MYGVLLAPYTLVNINQEPYDGTVVFIIGLAQKLSQIQGSPVARPKLDTVPGAYVSTVHAHPAAGLMIMAVALACVLCTQ